MNTPNFIPLDLAIQLQNAISQRVQVVGECWEFQGTRSRRGYGGVVRNKKRYRVSRVVYTLVFGEIPIDLFVLHRCDNPPCVRPHHLWLGTNAENTADMMQKGRQISPLKINPALAARGERNAGVKIAETDVPIIRARHAAGESCEKIAEDYPISFSTVYRIVARQIWTHVP